ncbi:MAG: hypothetical protein JSW45_02660, partial [Thiotrichales bacterium]
MKSGPTMTYRITKTWQVHIGFSWLLLVVILVASIDTCAESIHHDSRVQLRPQAAGINVTDYVQRPPDTDSSVFSSRSSLNVRAHGADLETPGDSADKRMRRHRINRLPPDGKVQLKHAGNIASARVKGTFDMPQSVL